MDGTVLGLFLLATFLGAFVSGLAGFAMGLVFTAIWAHILPPVQTASLIVGYGLVTQSYGIWKLRHALNWRNVAPFVVGGAVGVPLGAMLLTRLDPAHLRPAVGVLLVLYSTYALTRPALTPPRPGIRADAAVGILNGFLGGLTGLVGIVVTIWCQLRGWSKDAQRMVFQPVMAATSGMTAVSLALAGALTSETVDLFLLGLPLLLVGLWLGFRLYGKLDEAAFRKVMLAFLFLSGVGLIVPALKW
jgi:uncharacterized protein